MEKAYIALIILAVVFLLYLSKKVPMSAVSMLGAFAMAAFGILEPNAIFSALGGETVLIVLFMMILGEAMFLSGLAPKLGKLLVSRGGGDEKRFLMLLILFSAVFSMFLSNTATVAMFMSVVGALATTGRCSRKNTYMAIGIAATVGGLGTLVGSVVQVPVNNLLKETCGVALGFFGLMPITLVLLAVTMLYYLLVGCRLQDRSFDFEENTNDAEQARNVVPDRRKMILAGIALLACIVSFVTQILPLSLAAAAAVCMLLLTGGITEKQAYGSVNWSVIITLAGLVALANGVNASGAGKMIAEAILRVIAGAPRLAVFAVVVALCTLLTNMMSNPVVAMLVAPIALEIAAASGINPKTMAVGVIVGATIAVATPIGTPPVTMTLIGGYRFSDYLKVGGPLNLLLFAASVVFIPLIYGL